MFKPVISLATLPSVALIALLFALNDLNPPSLQLLWLPVLLSLGLLWLNGFFVTAEFAIINLHVKQLEERAEQGYYAAQTLLETLRTPKKLTYYILTTQIGITLVSIGLGMYAVPTFAAYLNPVLTQVLGNILPTAAQVSLSYGLTVALLVYLHVVIAELMPKSIAIFRPNSLALLTFYPMHLLQLLFKWPLRFLRWSTTSLLQVMGIENSNLTLLMASAEELELIVSASAEEGFINEEERKMLHNIFNFSHRQAEQVMTPRRKVEAIERNTPLNQILAFVADSPYSRFPVFEDNLDNVIGLLHVKDLVHYYLQTAPQQSEFNLLALCHQPVHIPENYSVDKLLNMFRRERIHQAVVVDEFGGTAGIITLEDLVEEVVGEVRDEFDAELDPLIELAPGSIEVSGDYLLDELSRIVPLPDDEAMFDDVETLGGLITTQLGRPAEIGDTIALPLETPKSKSDEDWPTAEAVNVVRFTVLITDGLAVARVRVDFPTSKSEANLAEVEQAQFKPNGLPEGGETS